MRKVVARFSSPTPLARPLPRAGEVNTHVFHAGAHPPAPKRGWGGVSPGWGCWGSGPCVSMPALRGTPEWFGVLSLGRRRGSFRRVVHVDVRRLVESAFESRPETIRFVARVARLVDSRAQCRRRDFSNARAGALGTRALEQDSCLASAVRSLFPGARAKTPINRTAGTQGRLRARTNPEARIFEPKTAAVETAGWLISPSKSSRSVGNQRARLLRRRADDDIRARLASEM
jgi:hypothetical protein